MKRIIDLSCSIFHQIPVFPADPAVGFMNHHSHKGAGYCVSQVIMGTHTGTHIDAPLHKIEDGNSIDVIPLEKFIGKALIVDLTYLNSGDEIKLANIVDYKDDIKKSKIVVLKTGWSKHFGEECFFTDFPGITFEAADWLSRQDINMIALESPSVHPTDHVRIHECFLKKDIVILETLCNLELLNNKFVELFAVPLKLKGLDGSPVRAFAIEK